MNKPDFITGATGIVGRELVMQLIKSGRRVVALHRESSDVESIEDLIPPNSPLIWVIGDLNDQESLEVAMKGCARVFHTAAIVSFHPNDEDAIIANNAEGTANVVNAMLHTGVLSSLRRILKKGLCSLIRLLSSNKASCSVGATNHSMSSIFFTSIRVLPFS